MDSFAYARGHGFAKSPWAPRLAPWRADIRFTPSSRALWNDCEEKAEAFGHGEVRDDGVAQLRVRKPRHHRGLDDGHNLAGLGADHGEAQDAIVARADHDLHEACLLAGRLCAQDLAHRQPPHPHRDALTLSLGFGEADARQRRVGEHDIGNQPIAGLARAASHIVRDDPEVVDRDMGELRASGAFPYRPYARSRRLQALVDADETARVEFHAGLVQIDA